MEKITHKIKVKVQFFRKPKLSFIKILILLGFVLLRLGFVCDLHKEMATKGFFFVFLVA